MPDDLQDLATTEANRRRFGVSPPSNGLQDLARTMTHQAPQPDPSRPYLDVARALGRGVARFSQSGLTGAFPSLRRYMPGFFNTLGDLVQSPVARDVFSSANVGGFGGILKLHPIGEQTLGTQSFKLIDQSGNLIGHSNMRWNPRTKGIFVGSLETDKGPMSVGTKEIRTIIPEIERHYPDVREITAIRATGAREKSGERDIGDMTISIYKNDRGQWQFAVPKDDTQAPAPGSPAVAPRVAEYNARLTAALADEKAFPSIFSELESLPTDEIKSLAREFTKMPARSLSSRKAALDMILSRHTSLIAAGRRALGHRTAG